MRRMEKMKKIRMMLSEIDHNELRWKFHFDEHEKNLLREAFIVLYKKHDRIKRRLEIYDK